MAAVPPPAYAQDGQLPKPAGTGAVCAMVPLPLPELQHELPPSRRQLLDLLRRAQTTQNIVDRAHLDGTAL